MFDICMYSCMSSPKSKGIRFVLCVNVRPGKCCLLEMGVGKSDVECHDK